MVGANCLLKSVFRIFRVTQDCEIQEMFINDDLMDIFVIDSREGPLVFALKLGWCRIDGDGRDLRASCCARIQTAGKRENSNFGCANFQTKIIL